MSVGQCTVRIKNIRSGSVKIALCQIASTNNTHDNLDQIRAAVHEAARQGAHLAVLPEFAMFYVKRLSNEFVESAEPLDGGFVAALKSLARETDVTIVAGMHVPAAGRVRNTLVAVNPHGDIVATYDKQHLYDAFGSKESDVVEAGVPGDAVQIEVEGVRVGLLTCYDLRFPEVARLHADAGTDVLLYPSAWMPGPRKEDHWRTLAKARAIENTVYVVAVSQAPPSGIGSSLAVDPNGITVAELGERPGIVTATLTSERITEVRHTNPSLANRKYRVVAKSE